MLRRATTPRVVYAIAILGTILVGFAVAQPWGYLDDVGHQTDAAYAVTTVLGIETITAVFSAFVLIPGGDSAAQPLLTYQLYPYVATIGSLVILLSGLYGVRESPMSIVT